MRPKQIIKTITSTMIAHSFYGASIYSISHSDRLIQVIMSLPVKYTDESFTNLLHNLTEQLQCNEHRIADKDGKLIKVEFAKSLPSNIPFTNSHFNPNTLKITLESAFESVYINLEDGCSCHLLTGGAPRMGKTKFMIYLTTMLYVQSDANIDLFIYPKGQDFYPFENKKNVEIVKNEDKFDLLLDKIIDLYRERENLLNDYPHAVDASTIKKLYPTAYHLFRPIIIVIDEYADFAERRDIQSKVEELVRRAGYMNVHVIIGVQRPEAKQILPANIKMGFQCRIAFRTVDTNNSIIILDEEGAEKLPKVQGRAILKDGDKITVQSPHLDYPECIKLLSKYERNVSHETSNNEEESRPTDSQHSNNIPNLFPKPIGLHGIQQQQQPNQRMQSNTKKTMLEWQFPSNPTVKR